MSDVAGDGGMGHIRFANTPQGLVRLEIALNGDGLGADLTPREVFRLLFQGLEALEEAVEIQAAINNSGAVYVGTVGTA